MFRTWRDDPQSLPLLLQGHPGYGKTFVAGAVVNHLRELGHACCCFFFNATGDSKSTVSSFLRSMAIQMAIIHPAILDVLVALGQRDVAVANVDNDTVWHRTYLSSLLEVSLHRKQYWIIDGLDECEDPRSLMAYLGTIKECWQVRIFITSRHAPITTGLLPETFVKDIPRTDSINGSNRDIAVYLRDKARVLAGLRPEEREHMMKFMARQAHGCFLLATLMVRQLESSRALEKTVRVSDIPTSVNDGYSRSLARALRSTFAGCILVWATHSMRTLSLDELRAALILEADSVVLDTNDVLERLVASECGGFTFIDSNKRLRLVHSSARDFLLHTQLPAGGIFVQTDANLHIAKVCLRWLAKQESLSVGKSRGDATNRQRSEADAFSNYATQNVFEHVKRVSKYDAGLLRQLLSFCESDILLNWIELMVFNSKFQTVLLAGNLILRLIRFRENEETKDVIASHKERSLENWGRDLVQLIEVFSQDLYNPSLSIRQLMMQVRTHREKRTPMIQTAVPLSSP